jgi:bacterial/archaeal transporter family-2 protein
MEPGRDQAPFFGAPVNNFYLLLAFVTGAGVAAQSVFNARLGFLLGGPIWAAAAQFVVGLLLLLLVAAATRQPAPVNVDLGGAPWWVWTGGAFGAAFIVVVILLTARIGATLTLASAIVGQLTAALVVDHYGLFGGTVVRLTPLRVIGVALLLLGVTLLRWKAS